MEKTDFTLPIELKQHTPILHFQHEQDGAGLRATELKPKLDRLLHQIMDVPDKWLVGGGHNGIKALDYKLKIRCTKVKDYVVASSIPRFVREEFQLTGVDFISGAPYFADNEPIKNKKLDDARRGRMMDNIQLEFFSFHIPLVEKIKEWLPVLLAYENFGLRQSKGFGGFFPNDSSINDFETALKKHPTFNGVKSNQPIALHYQVRGDFKSAFKKIDEEYKILKSGLAKEPSQMEEYFDEQCAIDWEKPTIKRELVKGRGEPRQPEYIKDTKVKYIRALLGVAELYEFPRDNKEKIMIKSNNIERFRSPITFKVFNETIYLIWRKIPPEIYDTTFTFTNRRGKSISINTPPQYPYKDDPKKEFSLEDFLLNHVDSKWNELKK